MPVIVESNTPKEEKDEWRTLPKFYKALDSIYEFQYDFAATKENALAPLYFTKEKSALDQEHWFTDLSIPPVGFLNPPFSMLGPFLKKANEQIKWAGKSYGYGLICCLVKADAPETKWWRENVLNKGGVIRHEIKYLYPRLPYLDSLGLPQRTPDGIRKSPMFPSALIVMRSSPWSQARWVDWRTLTRST